MNNLGKEAYRLGVEGFFYNGLRGGVKRLSNFVSSKFKRTPKTKKISLALIMK